MAIRAEQNTFAGLCPEALDAPSEPSVAEPEPLGGRVDVMKLERSHAPPIAAQDARPAGLGHEDLLDLSATSRDGFGPAPRTAPAAVAVLAQRGLAVNLAATLSLPGTAPPTGRPPTGAPSGPQAVAAQIALHGRDGNPELSCELTL